MAERMDAETDGATEFRTQQIDSIQARLAALESQHTWLRLEQLSAEVAGLRQTVDFLIEYIAERDGAAVVVRRD